MKKYFLLVVCATFSILSHAQSTWINPGVTQERFNLHVQSCQNNAQLAIARQQPPQLSPEQQYQQDLTQGAALAKMTPTERGMAGIYASAGQLGRAFGGAMGVQDPQTQRYMQLMFNQCMFGVFPPELKGALIPSIILLVILQLMLSKMPHSDRRTEARSTASSAASPWTTYRRGFA